VLAQHSINGGIEFLTDVNAYIDLRTYGLFVQAPEVVAGIESDLNLLSFDAPRKDHAMGVLKHCIASGCHPRTHSIALIIGIAVTSLASGESTRDFTILSPEHVVDLVQVEQTPSSALQFTFRNASNKAILELCISAQSGSKFEEMVCTHWYAGGETPPKPGDMMSFIFDASDFVSDGQSGGQSLQRSLRIYATVYTDGSHIGPKSALDQIEDHMIGVALETKRISDMLTASPDNSVTGLNSVLPQIGTSPPSTTSADAVDRLAGKLRGQSLPGIDQSYIDSHLNLHSTDLLDGVALARNRALSEMENLKATAALPHSGGKVLSHIATEARLQGRADLARKYQLLSMSQITYLAAFKGARNAR
jgi:hypothetical protein